MFNYQILQTAAELQQYQQVFDFSAEPEQKILLVTRTSSNANELDSQQKFALILCHDCFINNSKQTLAEQVDALQQLAQLAPEVRVFPLNTADAEPSPHMGPLIQALQETGYDSELQVIAQPLKPEQNVVLVIRARECQVS